MNYPAVKLRGIKQVLVTTELWPRSKLLGICDNKTVVTLQE
jgi:hypothetical protein